MGVEGGDGNVLYARPVEAFERGGVRTRHACWLKFKERLIGGHFARLRRPRLTVELLQRLPAQPTELVVVPHVDEGPACACVLQVRVVQVGAVNGAVIVERGGDVQVADLFAVGIAHDVAQAPVVHALRAIFGIPDDLVNEVAEMQHKGEAVGFAHPFVFEDHPAIAILCALVGILATHENERYRARIAGGGRRDGAANAAAVALGITEAVPIHAGRLEAAYQHATRKVSVCRDWRARGCDHMNELRVASDFQLQTSGVGRAGP